MTFAVTSERLNRLRQDEVALSAAVDQLPARLRDDDRFITEAPGKASTIIENSPRQAARIERDAQENDSRIVEAAPVKLRSS